MSKRLFWRFKAHDTGTFVGWDLDGKRALTYRSDDADGREQSIMMQCQALERVDRDAYVPGMPIRVQFGDASRWTSQMNGGTRWMTFPKYGGGHSHRQVDALVGHRCVTAITHANPRFALLSVHAMLDQFGPEETVRHMTDFAEGASSLQHEVSLSRWRGDYGASSFSTDKGMLTMHRKLSDQVWIKGRALHFRAQLPESVVLALPGRPLSTVLDHATTRDPALTIERLRIDGERMEAWTEQVVTLEQAVAVVRELSPPLAKAA